MVEKRIAKQNAKPALADARLRSADDRNWSCFESAIRGMLPTEAAGELLTHGRAHYFSAQSRQWRDALRESERSQRQGFGGKRRSIHGV